MIGHDFPYLDTRDINLDWLLKNMKTIIKQWADYQDYMNQQFSDLEAAFNTLKDWIDGYFDNLDVQQEINNKLDAMRESGELESILQPIISDETAAWLAAHITQPTTPAIDNSLTVQGAAADAKATGDAITRINKPSIEAILNTLALFNSDSIPEGLIKAMGEPISGTAYEGKAWRYTKTTTDGDAYKYADYTFPSNYDYGLFIITGHSWSYAYPLISFYDSNDNFISCVGERDNNSYSNYITTIPKGAVRAVVNGAAGGDILIYAAGRNFIDAMANNVSPFAQRIDLPFIGRYPDYAQIRNWPTNYVYSLSEDAYTAITDIPSDVENLATVVKFSPSASRTGTGYSMYIVADNEKLWYGFDTGTRIIWNRAVSANEIIPAASVSADFVNITPDQIVQGKVKHINGNETSGLGYIYNEFAATAGDTIYVSGYHYANSYPLYIVYAGNTRIDYAALGNNGRAYHQYKITVPATATKIIVNGLAHTGPVVDTGYGYPAIQKADDTELLSIPKDRRRYLFIGDSYCEGYSHDGLNDGWAQYCAEYMGLSVDRYVRAYRGGARFSANDANNTFLAQLKLMQSPFDYFTDIVICGGYNDNSYTAEQILTGISNFVTMARRMFPYARIHIGFIAWNKAGSGEGAITEWADIHARLINTVLPAYQKCTEYGASYMPNVEYWLNDALMTNSDGYHPGEAGNRSIARAIANVLLTGSAPLPYNGDLRLQ